MTSAHSFTRRNLVAAIGFALGITCVTQVVFYKPVNRGLDVDSVVLMLGLPIFVAALCVRHFRPAEPKSRRVRVALGVSVGMVYLLTVAAYGLIAFLRDAWMFGDLWAPRPVYERLYLALIACTVGAGAFGCVCLGCLLDKWLFRDAAEPAQPTTADGGSGVYAGACRSGPAPVSPSSHRIRRHPCE